MPALHDDSLVARSGMSAPSAIGRRFEQAPDIDAFLSIWLEERGLLQGEAAATFNTYYGKIGRAHV